MEKNRKITRLAQHLRANATKEENTLWYQYLRRYPVQFRRQCPFGRYIVDFYCASAKVVIELDGSQHFEPQAVAYDADRSAFLSAQGLQVLRFTNLEVDKNFSAVCQQIDVTIQKRL